MSFKFKTALVALLSGAGLIPATVAAEDTASEDRAKILSVLEDTFKAVASRNPDDWRKIQYAEGVAVPVIIDPEQGNRMRILSNEDTVSRMQPIDEVYLERWTEDPTILIDGPLAHVWGRYDFWIDGRFNHCGTNSIDLVKMDGTWKVVNVLCTMDKTHCPTKDSPPPK